MTKIAVAALVLGLAGVALAGWHVQCSIAAGVCPLTGKPIACRSHRVETPLVDSSAPSDGVAADIAPAAAASVNADEQPRSCCCRHRVECSKCEEKQECETKCEEKKPETPAAPAQNP